MVLTLATSGIGEWVSAYIFFALAFCVAIVGVTVIATWVLRADARNRQAQRLAAQARQEAGQLLDE